MTSKTEKTDKLTVEDAHKAAALFMETCRRVDEVTDSLLIKVLSHIPDREPANGKSYYIRDGDDGDFAILISPDKRILSAGTPFIPTSTPADDLTQEQLERIDAMLKHKIANMEQAITAIQAAVAALEVV